MVNTMPRKKKTDTVPVTESKVHREDAFCPDCGAAIWILDGTRKDFGTDDAHMCVIGSPIYTDRGDLAGHVIPVPGSPLTQDAGATLTTTSPQAVTVLGDSGPTDHPSGPVHDTIPDGIIHQIGDILVVDDKVDEWHADPGGKSLPEHLGMTPGEYAKWVSGPKWDANDIAHLTGALNDAQEEVNRRLGMYRIDSPMVVGFDPGTGPDTSTTTLICMDCGTRGIKSVAEHDAVCPGVANEERAQAETLGSPTDTIFGSFFTLTSEEDIAAIRKAEYANGYADGVALNQDRIAALVRIRKDGYADSIRAEVVRDLSANPTAHAAVIARILRDAEAGRLKIAEWVTRGSRHVLRQMVTGTELGEVFVTTDEQRRGQHVLLYGAKVGSVPMPVDADLDTARAWVEARNVGWVVA